MKFCPKDHKLNYFIQTISKRNLAYFLIFYMNLEFSKINFNLKQGPSGINKTVINLVRRTIKTIFFTLAGNS